MESLIGNRESEVRNQLLVHMYENATFDMDTTNKHEDEPKPQGW